MLISSIRGESEFLCHRPLLLALKVLVLVSVLEAAGLRQVVGSAFFVPLQSVSAAPPPTSFSQHIRNSVYEIEK